MDPEEIQEQIESLPEEGRAALRRAFEILVQCFTKDGCRGMMLVTDEDEATFLTMGLRADYDECFHMVLDAYKVFIDANSDGAQARRLMQ